MAVVAVWMIVTSRRDRARQREVVARLSALLGGRAASEDDALASPRTPRLEMIAGSLLVRLQWGRGGWGRSGGVALTWVDAHPPLAAAAVPSWPSLHLFPRALYRLFVPTMQYRCGDVAIDQGPFDAAFRLHCDDPAQAAAMLNPAARDALLAAGEVTLSCGRRGPLVRGGVAIPVLTLTMRAHVHDDERLVRAVAAVSECLRALGAT